MSTNADARPYSRRMFFMRGTALAAATAVPSVVLAAPALAERPELLALAAKLDEAEASHAVALEAKRAARAMYDRIVPETPDDLLLSEVEDAREYNYLRQACADEKCIDGGVVWPKGEPHRRPRQIIMADRLKSLLRSMDGRARLARRVRARLPIAEAHEAACAEAARLSDYHGASNRRQWAEREVERVVVAAFGIPAATMTGVAIKARALLAFAQCSPETNGRTWVPMVHGNDLAAEIVSIAGNKGA